MSAQRFAGCGLSLLLSALVLLTSACLAGGSDHAEQSIIGGQPSAKGYFPSIALILSRVGRYEYRCGGSLVAPSWVLTAAHCTYDEEGAAISPSAMTAVLGRTKKAGKDGEDVKVSEIVRHPGYGTASSRNDLALLRLSKPSLQAPIQIIDAIADADLIASGKEAYIAGWGYNVLTPKPSFSDDLLQTTVRIKSDDECLLALRSIARGQPVSYDAPSMLCAGGEENIDSCPGDSGGPLMVRRENSPWLLAGVVSYSLTPADIPCGYKGSPGVYADPAALRGFIETTLTKNGISVPAQPANLRASRASAGTIDVSWEDKSWNELRFTVGVQAKDSNFWSYYTVPAEGVKKKVIALTGKIYYVSVRACNNAGCSKWLDSVAVP